MNRNDEHLIFEELKLFDGYSSYPNQFGFVDSITHMDMELCLEQHPNWSKIRTQPPLLIYDCPTFASDVDLMDYFCEQASDQEQQSHICEALKGWSGHRHNQQARQYRLVIYSAQDPTTPIGFSSFDLALTEDIEQNEIHADINLIGLRCDFLYAYVLPDLRDMGVGAVLGMVMGNLFWQQLHHVWLQVNDSETALVPLIYSENFSRGGQEIIKTVLRELKIFSDAQDKQNGSNHHLRQPQIIG